MSTKVGRIELTTRRFDFASTLLSQSDKDNRLFYYLDLLEGLAKKKLKEGTPSQNIEDAGLESLNIKLAKEDNVTLHMMNKTFLDTSTFYTDPKNKDLIEKLFEYRDNKGYMQDKEEIFFEKVYEVPVKFNRAIFYPTNYCG